MVGRDTETRVHEARKETRIFKRSRKQETRFICSKATYLADANHAPILPERSHKVLISLFESPVKGLDLLQLRPLVHSQEGEGMLLCRELL